VTCALLIMACAASSARAGDMKLRTFLLWGTNEGKPPPNKAYRPADAEIQQKLKELPLKWTNWFEVNRKEYTAPPQVTKEVSMSSKCQVRVKPLGGAEVEVLLIGQGREVMKRKQALPAGELLVLGGNAPNSTAWLVVLKRVE
jgi:hypothetical protein